MKSRLTLPLLVVLTIAGYGYGVHGSVPDVPTGQWMPGGSLAQPREGAVSVALDDGRVLVIGGRTAAGPVATVEALNADGSLTVLPLMSAPRVGHTAVLLADGSVLVAGGTTMVATDQGTVEAPTSSAEIFAPGSNTWSAASPLGVARSAHTATALADGRVLIAGGTSEQGPLDSMEVFEPQEGTFRAAGVLSAARAEAAAAAAGKTQVLVVGGRNADGVLATADLVDVESGAVAPLALSSPRAGASATKLLDGTVFVAGGNDGQNDLATAEVIDAATGASSVVGSMAQPRSRHQATLLDHNANVLIVGGTNNGATVTTAETFVPWMNQFAATNSPAAPRTNAIVNSTSTEGVATLVAGKGGDGSLVAATELYGFATVKTDKDDYAPGTTVVITGSGWQPGETVHLLLHEVGTGEPDVPLIATANASGAIFNDVWAPDEHDDGVRFYLTATGVGATAQTTFTDRNPQSITVGAPSSDTVSPGDSVSYNVTVAFAGNADPCTVTLNVTGLPTGAGFSFSSDNQPSASTPNGPINVARTLTITTTASGPLATPAGTYNFSVTGTNGVGCQGPGPTPGAGTLKVGASTFSVTFDATAIADVAGTTQVLSVTIGGGSPTAVTKADLPKTFTGVASGASVSYSYLSTLASTTTGKRYRWNTTSGTGSASGASLQSGSFTVTSTSSVTATHMTQWQLSLATNPAAVGTNHITGLASGGWYDANTTATLTADENVDIVADTSRYHFTAWSDASTATTLTTTVTMDAAKTLTANYGTQYKLTLATDPAAVGTSHVSGLATGGWYNADATASLTADAEVDIVAGASRYVFTAWSGASTATTVATTVLMDTAKTLTANYTTQYKLTLATDPAAVGTSHISGLATEGWYNAGASASLTADEDIDIVAGASRYHFTAWSGASTDTTLTTTVTMDAAKTLTANYVTQYKLTLATDPAAVGTSHISGLATGGWYNAGATPSLTADEDVDIVAGASRYHFTGWSGASTATSPTTTVTMDAAKTLTANYVTQYKLTLATNPAAVGISHISGLATGGWYNAGSTASLTAAENVDIVAGASRYHFTAWSGASTAATLATTVLMDAAKTVTANYVKQYQVTFDQNGISSTTPTTGSNFVVKIGADNKTVGNLPFSEWYDENANIVYSFYTPISTDPVSDKQYELTNGGSLPASPVSVTGAMTITGQYTLYNYSILYHQPMDQSTASSIMVNAGKNGRVIPVKVELFKNGKPVQTGTVLMKVTGSNCSGGALTDLLEEYADAGSSNGNTNLFRWSAGSPGFWIYNLDTRALGLQLNLCYRLDVYLNATTGSNAVLASSSVFALFKPVK
jgi:uncharacterized repeat protein (TIGR02543 family)